MVFLSSQKFEARSLWQDKQKIYQSSCHNDFAYLFLKNKKM